MHKPKVTVVIPTYNRPDLVPKAIQSVLDQTFQDFEIVVVDDGQKKSAKEAVEAFEDDRIRYFKHTEQKGCSGAKNTGIRAAGGQYIAFLDDDDEYLKNKLSLQVDRLNGVGENVGFSFTGTINVYDDHNHTKSTADGVADYHELALRNFSAMIASTLMFKKEIFNAVGYLDETFPTHTDIEFLIRVTKKFKGVGIDQPLVRMMMKSDHVQMGSNIRNRIKGREMLLSKYRDEFARYPTFLAKHLTLLGIFYRTVGEYKEAGQRFWQACKLQFRLRRFLQYISMLFNGLGYRVLQK